MTEKKKRKKLKKSVKKILIIFIIIILLIVLAISIYKIVQWHIDNNSITDQINDIQEQVTVNEIVDTAETEIIEQNIAIDENNPYWDYISMNLIDVDFKELKSINSSTVGWIQVNGTNINYPFVQADDNSYYLTHSFDKSYNKSGWVFMDYRNNIINKDKNTILYAHARVNNTMFGSLKNVLTNGWLDDTDNYVIKLSTEIENTLWQVFSVYHIPETSDYLKINFSSDEQFLEFANMLLDRSAHNFNTTINENDCILTLSTCYKYDNNERVVLHAKLIKKVTK